LLKDFLTTKVLTKRAEPISSAKKHCLCLVFYHHRSQGSSVSILFDFLQESCVQCSKKDFELDGCVSSFKCKSMFWLKCGFLAQRFSHHRAVNKESGTYFFCEEALSVFSHNYLTYSFLLRDCSPLAAPTQ